MNGAMNRREFLAAALAASGTGPAIGETPFPSGPITVVVPFGPGGIADLTARTVGQALSVTLKQPVVIENRPSAGNIVGSAAVAKAPATGYTLLLVSNGNAVSAGLFKHLPYDTVKDFAPISTLGFFDLAVFVKRDSAIVDLRALLAQARSQPGKLTVGTIAVGSTQNLAAELFKSTAGVDMLIVPYNGTPALQTALLAGEVDVAIEVLGPMMAQLGPKGLRALAVTSDRRFPGLPDVPTAQEAGLTGFNVASWNGLSAPKGTPLAVIALLHAAVEEAVGSSGVQERLQAIGVRARASSPEQMNALLTSEITRWSEVIARAHIQRQER